MAVEPSPLSTETRLLDLDLEKSDVSLFSELIVAMHLVQRGYGKRATQSLSQLAGTVAILDSI